MVSWNALAAVLLAVAALAGCAGNSPSKGAKPEADFSDLPVQVTDTTGAIRCLVVDERIKPVEKAKVSVRGEGVDQAHETDSEGRCVFSGLPTGTYFLDVTSPLHKATQTSVEVVAGVAEPPLTRIQVERLFTQDPYSISVARDGFFQCSQAGASVWYSSSTCADGVFGPGSQQEPALSNLTTQQREWHSDVPPGWQVLVFEMTWEPTSQGTSTNMGLVVSTYKPTRDTAHWFAEFSGASPVRGELDVGVTHDTASGVDPEQVPAEGMSNMSYFAGVRGDGLTPGLALNQQFTVYLTELVYGRPSEGWSLVAGDPLPF